MVECVVCLYWMERIEEAEVSPLPDANTVAEAKRLTATLEDHQSCGACARRLPRLLSELRERSAA
jgi:hypothetical protein